MGDLYAWHYDVVRFAIRDRDPESELENLLPRLLQLNDGDAAAIAQATTDVFDALGRASRNGEHGEAIEAIGSRLYLARFHESDISERRRELVTVWNAVTTGPVSAGIEAIRAYHRRRLRRVPAIVRAIYVP